MAESDPPPHPYRGQSNSQHDEDDWYGNQKFVLAKLRELERENSELLRLVVDLRVQIAVLTTRVSLYAAGVAVVVTAIVEIVSKTLGK